MGILNPGRVDGHVVEMNRTHNAHMNSAGRSGLPPQTDEVGFASLLTGALGRVSERQIAADELFEKMITHPDLVEPHEVTIAMAQAEMSLNLTKTIIDRAVKAYNDITAMR